MCSWAGGFGGLSILCSHVVLEPPLSPVVPFLLVASFFFFPLPSVRAGIEAQETGLSCSDSVVFLNSYL